MKTSYGSRLQRLFRGGVSLSATEQTVLASLVEQLSVDIRSVVEAQFESYDLVQREVDGRALNFYPSRSAASKLPLLAMTKTASPLMRLTFMINDQSAGHAVLLAVNQRAFCVNLNNRLDGLDDVTRFRVIEAVDAWRSNVRADVDAPAAMFHRSSGSRRGR